LPPAQNLAVAPIPELVEQGGEVKQLHMTWWTKPEHDFEGSLYREACPTCDADPFCWCRTVDGKRRDDPHPDRRGANAPTPERSRPMVRIKEV